MRFWRICQRRYATEATTGEGARLYGGRWNSRGLRVVYASSSLALAAVETFVNLEPNLIPADLESDLLAYLKAQLAELGWALE
jgi:RES domain-containing protein